MKAIAILGGSVIGSAGAIQFARAGWQVTVIDAEFPMFDRLGAEPVVRPGAPQTVQAHGFPSRVRFELSHRLPDVFEAVLKAGAEDVPPVLPPPLLDGGRSDDDDLASFRCRRVTLDAVLARASRSEPGVTLLHERVTGIELTEGSPPRAIGWRLATGEVVRADVLVDAGGRRSPVTEWLAAAGLAQPEMAEECGLSYYGRHFRITGARAPLNSGFADIHEFPTHLQLGFLGDNNTMMMALSPHADDPPLKVLRHEGAFTALLDANKAFAPWLRVLAPISGIFCLGSLKNRMRSMVAGERPVVLGLYQVGDALAMTNPNRGRGVSMGLAALGRLGDLLATGTLDPEGLALEYDAWQRDVLAVYYREATAADAQIGRRLRANLLGDAAPANAPALELPPGHPVTSQDIERVAGADPDLFRMFLRAMNLLDDDRKIASPHVVERVRQLLADAPPPPPTPPREEALPDRERVLEILAPFS